MFLTMIASVMLGVAVNSDQGWVQGAGGRELAKGGSSRVSSASANHLSGMSGRKLCTKKVFNESTSKARSRVNFYEC